MPKSDGGATACDGGRPDTHALLSNVARPIASVKSVAAAPSPTLALVDPEAHAEQVAELVFVRVAELLRDPSQGERLDDDAGMRQVLRCSQPVLRALVEKGLPCVRVGEMRRYRRATVFAWLESRETKKDHES